MKSYENHVSIDSEYFIYAPSANAYEMFFYPLYVGHFIYEKDYCLSRDSYHSFLLMYIQAGSLTLEYEGKTRQISSGNFVFIDCFKPHSYYSNQGWESIWFHFDGLTARAFYNNIISRLGNSFSLEKPYSVIHKITKIYDVFSQGNIIREPFISKYINDILTSFLIYSPNDANTQSTHNMTEEIMSYINENFTKDVTITELAKQASLSPYHFIRTFKKETGFTPYEYLVNTRINTAKYLLKNTKLTIKDICFQAGFSCESIFCNSFKKHVNITPAQYRSTNISSE